MHESLQLFKRKASTALSHQNLDRKMLGMGWVPEKKTYIIVTRETLFGTYLGLKNHVFGPNIPFVSISIITRLYYIPEVVRQAGVNKQKCNYFYN